MDSNVVDLIMNDHRELERIFDQLMTQPDKRPSLVPVMITLLTAHSRAEESEVYPAAKDSGGSEDVEHSQKEHLEADQLAAKVAETDYDSPEFGEALQKLIDAVKHHVEEEETDLLPTLEESVDRTRLEELGERFEEQRVELLSDHGYDGGAVTGDETKAELYEHAKEADIPGRSSMNKDELARALRD